MNRQELFLYNYYGCPPPPPEKRDEECTVEGCAESAWIQGNCPDHLSFDLATIWSGLDNTKSANEFLKLLGHKV